MQEIEMKHKKLIEFEKRFSEFQKKFAETNRLMDNLKDIPRFIERSMPLYIHFEISTAMRSVLGDTLPNKILDFEKSKLKELLKFITI